MTTEEIDAGLMPPPPRRIGVLAGMSLVLRLELGAVFLWAAYAKLFEANGPQNFANSIKSFKLGLPGWSIQWGTFVMPWIELVCAAALIVGLMTRAAAWVIGLMLVFFTVLVVSAIQRHLPMEHCGCFGERGLICKGAPDWCHVIENSVMIVSALIIAFTPRHVAAMDQFFCRKGGPADGA